MYIEELLTLYNEDGSEVALESIGLYGLKLLVPSPTWVYETVTIEGMPGERVIDRRLGPRSLTGTFFTNSDAYVDSLEDRDRLYAYLMNGREFYIGEKNVTGKRWKVRPGDWSPERIDTKVQTITIPLTADTGSSETIQKHKSIFTQPNITFKNRGNVLIEMLSQNDTEIEFRGSSTNLQIVNKTTGDIWKYTGSTVAGDVVLLKGVTSTKNGVSIFGQTNQNLLSFAPGWNELEVTGATNFTLTINTRFYFL